MTLRTHAVAVCLLGLATLPLAAQTEPTVDDIVQKYVDAVGGKAKIDSIKGMKMTGKLILGGGQMEAPMTATVKRPNMSYAEINFQGKKIVEAFDGTTKWSINPMSGSNDPQVADAEETKNASEDADEIEGPLVNYKAKGHTLELLGKEDVEGTAAYKLKLTTKSGNVRTFWVDASNYLPVKLVAKRKMMGQEIETESFPGNYKKVDGYTLPFAVETKAGGRSVMQIQFEKAEINPAIDEKIFKMPAKEEKKEEKK